MGLLISGNMFYIGNIRYKIYLPASRGRLIAPNKGFSIYSTAMHRLR